MSKLSLVGTAKNLALFETRGKSVVVNTRTLTAALFNPADLDRKKFSRSTHPIDPVWEEIAGAFLKKELSPPSLTASMSLKRTYTVPRRVAETAELSSRTDGIRTPVGEYVAKTLSSGEQITCEDVLWVARFFDNNSKNNTSKATWSAWGGDESKKWATALASRLDYDSVTADAGTFDTPGIQVFADTDTGNTFWTELAEDGGQHAISLYMLSASGEWSAWGNGDWFECAQPDPTPRFIEVDEDCALYLAGSLFDAPDLPVDLRTPDPEAWDLAMRARDEIDYTLIDRVMIAAGEPTGNPVTDDYTPEERSQNTQSQVRDANGRFVEVGGVGAVKSTGMGGTIESADPATGLITITGDDGQSYEVQASDFEVGAAPHPKADPGVAKDSLNLDGILAPPPEDPEPKANLAESPGKIMGPGEVKEALDTYQETVTDSRQKNAKKFKDILKPETIQAAAEIGDTPAPADDVPPPTPNPTPDTTDVEPVYLAIVAKDDPRAVMELVALVPATATSSEPKTFRRAGGAWVEDPKILQDMRSATPPSLIQLDADQYKDVLAQVDMGTSDEELPEEKQTITASAIQVENPQPGDQITCPGCGDTLSFDPLDGFQRLDGSVSHDDGSVHSDYYTVVAAGGLDRNRGNAEELREYWTVGTGGLKVRWNTGGDWTRCVRLLSKYLGNRAKGYCALRHKEMTGMWPGDRKNREMSGASITASGTPRFSTDEIKTLPAVLRASADAAMYEVAKARVFGTYQYDPVPQDPEEVIDGRRGREFTIPLVIPEGIATGDGRTFNKGALGLRSLPIPLLWQIKTGSGHDGSVLVGRIDRVERLPHGLGNAYGVFDTGPFGAEAQRLVESGMLRWISADLDKFEIDQDRSDEKTGKMFIKKGRLMGATLVPKPAFQECTIELVPLEERKMSQYVVPSAISASASIAKNIPVEPPSTWFERPVLNGPTPIRVDDSGHIFGHIATWDRTHIGMAGEVRAPRSYSNYAYFHTGVVRTQEGSDVRVGQLTLAGGHAPIHMDASLAVKHYDDTASAIADVHAGEDSFGIWVSGALRPGTTPEQIRSLRASAPSGDWRAINHRLELVAVCQVNVPGFPVPRALAASGAMTALVAAGTSSLLAARASEIPEDDTDPALVAAALAEKIYNPEGYLAEFKDFSQEKRDKLAKEGKALSDGSFPIENEKDLRRAVMAYGRASESKRAQVRRHIVKRARALGKTELVPDNWKELSMTLRSLDNRDRYDSLVASARMKKVEELRGRMATPEQLAEQAAAIRSRITEQ